MRKTKKTRNLKLRKTKKNRQHDRLSIDIDFTSKDGGFSVFTSKKMMDFFRKNIKNIRF